LQRFLLMNFRNKFLHDINCNSFIDVLYKFDNGIKNKFKVFLEEGGNLEDESSCKIACSNLFDKNILTIRNKVEKAIQKIQNKTELVNLLINNNVKYNEVISDLVSDLFLILKNTELTDKSALILAEKIFKKLKSVSHKLISENEMELELENFYSSKEKMMNFYGYVESSKFPSWQDFKNNLINN